MHEQAALFLNMLFAPCTSGHLTLTAIHPDGQHPTPSRHIAIHDANGLAVALADLQQANEQGWGAFFGVSTRRANLGRWRRGGQADLCELPALFVDLDVPVSEAMQRLRAQAPPPSCLVSSGGGVHAYWWLDPPTSDWSRAGQALRQLRQRLSGDKTALAQSLRLPSTRNTKPQRHNAPCHILDLSPIRYPLDRFVPPISTQPTGSYRPIRATPPDLSQTLVSDIEAILIHDYGGVRQRNGWIGALCPCGHRVDRPGMHFAFNSEKKIGVCLGRHGRLLLKDLCAVLGLNPADYSMKG